MGGCATHPQNVADEEIIGAIEKVEGEVEAQIATNDAMVETLGGENMTYQTFQTNQITEVEVGNTALAQVDGSVIAAQVDTVVTGAQQHDAYNPETDGRYFDTLEEAQEFAAKQQSELDQNVVQVVEDQQLTAPVNVEEVQALSQPHAAQTQPIFHQPIMHIPQQPMYYNQANANGAAYQIPNYQTYPQAVADTNVQQPVEVVQPVAQPVVLSGKDFQTQADIDGVVAEVEDEEAVDAEEKTPEVEKTTKDVSATDSTTKKKSKRSVFGWFK